MGEVSIAHGNTRAVVQLQGGMTTGEFPVDGRQVDPFYRAGWEGFAESRLLDKLRGDFVCAPFGVTPAAPLPGWPAPQPDRVTEYAHGYCSHGDWEVVQLDEDRVQLSIAYPDGDPVERVTRVVACLDGEISFEDRILTRVDASLPLGLHPTFRLPETPGAATLELPATDWLQSPAAKPEESSRLTPAQRFDDPAAAPSHDGTADLTRLPWEGASEDLVMLVGVQDPTVALVNHEDRYRVRVTWDTSVLKHLLLWVSNRGRNYLPWNGGNRCLGIEPITSAFDYGTSICSQPNPLSEAGAPTTVALKAGEELVIRHTVTVEGV